MRSSASLARVSSVEAERLEHRAVSLREEIKRLRDSGSGVAPDPVGEFYAWVTRGLVSVRDVGFGFPLFFAFLIEVVSALGPVTIAAYAEATRAMNPAARYDGPQPAMSGHVTTQPDMTGALEAPLGTVLSWLAERAAPTADQRAVSLENLHQDYVHWCGETRWRAASREAFEREFDDVRELPDLAGKIRKFGDRYYGIALVGGERARKRA
jgi:hypothetical protein